MPAIVEHRPDIVDTTAVAVHPAPSVDAQRKILSTLEIVDTALQVPEDADLAVLQSPARGGTRQESTAIQTRRLMMALVDTIL